MWDEPVSSEKLFFTYYNHLEVVPPSSPPHPHPPSPPHTHLFRFVFQILFWQDEGENSWRTDRKYFREESQIEENKAYTLRKENDPCL